MAARRSVAQTADTSTDTPTDDSPVLVPVTGTDLPEVWGDVSTIEEFNGHNLTDKGDLIGIPFLIIGAEIERRPGKDYDVAYVYALDSNGTEFEFSDTSTTGVRAQIQGLLTDKGLSPTPGDGFQTLRIVIRNGLRVSEFKVLDKEAGKMRSASTYYLSAAGRKIG